MAWSGLTGYILCCQLNNFMANVAYIFWFNTACANKDFLLSYYSMSKRYVEILQESYWQKGQVHFLKKHQKKTMLVGTCSVSAIPPQHDAALCTYHHPPTTESALQHFKTSPAFCLSFFCSSTSPAHDLHAQKPFIMTALWEEPRAPHEADRTRAPRFALNWNLAPHFRDSALPALTAQQLDLE